MKVISLNANGIRSSQRKGLFDWLKPLQADFICLQEVRADMHTLAHMALPGYHAFHSLAVKKGYSGVSIYSLHQPRSVSYGLDWADFDAEGRLISLRFAQLEIDSLYLPSGTSGSERQAFKMQALERMKPWFSARMQRSCPQLICGDFNIAHRPIDLKNWKQNQKNSGFLPEERAWLDWLFGKAQGAAQGVDVFRMLNSGADQYTWWSNRGRARENNVGWRIDYQVANRALAQLAHSESIAMLPKLSDHAPLIIDYDLQL